MVEGEKERDTGKPILHPHKLEPRPWTFEDPFHRLDNAAWRAVNSCPPAARFFVLARELDCMLGQGEGDLLWRGVSKVLGEQHVGRIRTPGATRKVGYLSGTPGTILENLKVLVASLHARVAWSQDGHRHHSVADLTRVCREVTDISFVTFGCVFKDILQDSQLFNDPPLPWQRSLMAVLSSTFWGRRLQIPFGLALAGKAIAPFVVGERFVLRAPQAAGGGSVPVA